MPPIWPPTPVVQTQYSLTQQLQELVHIANRSGLYDAADWLKTQLEQPAIRK